jgi:serine/threonine protein kinase
MNNNFVQHKIDKYRSKNLNTILPEKKKYYQNKINYYAQIGGGRYVPAFIKHVSETLVENTNKEIIDTLNSLSVGDVITVDYEFTKNTSYSNNMSTYGYTSIGIQKNTEYIITDIFKGDNFSEFGIELTEESKQKLVAEGYPVSILTRVINEHTIISDGTIRWNETGYFYALITKIDIKKSVENRKLSITEIRTSVIEKNGDVKVLKALSPHVYVCKKNTEIFVRYVIPNEIKWIGNKLIEATKSNVRHPNVLMSLVAVKHTNRDVDVDVEYADAGSLASLLQYFPINKRTDVAKSVARQIFQSLFYHLVVHNKEHRNVNPESVFLRRDGCVKLGFFDLINEDHVALNIDRFMDSPYCAPESKVSVRARVNTDSKADVWAVGALIVSIMTGKSFLRKGKRSLYPGGDYNFRDSYNGNENYDSDFAFFETLVNYGTNEMWKNVIPDAGLRHLAKRCLRLKKENRATIGECCALTILLGGLQNPDGSKYSMFETENDALAPKIPDPFATDPESLKEVPKITDYGKKMREILFPAYDFITDEEIYLKGDSAVALQKLAELSSSELNIWKVAREDNTKRSLIDKIFREITKQRQSLAWKTLSVCISEALQKKSQNKK